VSAVALPRVAASNVTATVSPEENPEPEAVVFVVGGPEFGESVTDAASAKLPAEIPTIKVERSATRVKNGPTPN
jgi:hypothetical protein